MSLKPEDKKIPFKWLWDTKIESEHTKKLSEVWSFYFFEYIPRYFEELEKRLDIHEKALEDILTRKEELRDAEIKALQDGQKEIIERLDSVIASVEKIKEQELKKLEEEHNKKYPLDAWRKKNPDKKWVYGVQVYGKGRWKEICDRLNIHYRNHYANDEHLIIACRDIPKWDVKIGDIGGFVPSEIELPQDDESWVWGANTKIFSSKDTPLENESLIYYEQLTTFYGRYSGTTINDGKAHNGVLLWSNAYVFEFDTNIHKRPWNDNRFWLVD